MATILLPTLTELKNSSKEFDFVAFSGHYIDQAWLSQDTATNIFGLQTQDIRMSGSSYGNIIPRIWGAYRLPGNIIWSANPQGQTRSFAIAICRGPILAIRKIWANNKLIYHVGPGANDNTISASNRLSQQMTAYFGTETQEPNLLMSLGAITPAYRGIVYIVFQNLNLERWDNRIPNFNFEVIQKGQDSGAGYSPIPVNVSEIISDLCLEAGYTHDDFDVTDVHGVVNGFCTTGKSFMDDISSICKIAGISWRQYGKKLVFFPQNQTNIIVIPRQDIGVEEGENETIKIIMTNKNQLPTVIDIEYFDINKGYLTAVQSATRSIDQYENRLTMHTQIATDANVARTMAYRILMQIWNSACEYRFKLGPKWLHLVPGDVLDITTLNGIHHIVQIKEMTIGVDYSIEILARTYDNTVFTIEEEGDSGESSYDQIEVEDQTGGEVGVNDYYAFNVADGDVQLPETNMSSTIRAYGSGASQINLDISLTSNPRIITIVNDSTSVITVKASTTGQSVKIYPSGVKKVVRMDNDVIKLASLTGAKAEDVTLLYDWNMVLDTGFYRGTDMLNKPADSGYWQYCIVIQHDPSFVVQLLFDFGTTQGGINNAWIRKCEAYTWTAWKALA